MPLYPPSGGGTITGPVSGHGQQPLFGNNSGYFFDVNGQAWLSASTGALRDGVDFNTFFSNVLSGLFQISANDGSFFWDAGQGNSDGAGGLSATSLTSSNLFFDGIPTSDPHVIGELWSNLGIATISAG